MRATTRKTKDEVVAALRQIPAIMSGQVPDSTGMAEPMLRHLGQTAQAIFHAAFLLKSKGGTDAAGIHWPDLSTLTKAYSRSHPGLVRKKKGERPRGLLSEAQDARWRQLYAHAYGSLLRDGNAAREAGAHAAAYAWSILKAEGARTMRQEYGSRPVDILIDKGDLAESLRPGSGHPDQILEIEPGAVTIGSARKYAGAHQNGVPGRLPQRKLWPDNGDLPAEWADQLMKVVGFWMGLMAQALVSGGSAQRAA